MTRNQVNSELHTYSDLQSQLKQIQGKVLNWRQFDKKTYRQMLHFAENLLQFIRSSTAGFQTFTTEQQFAIQTSQYELDAILLEWNEENFSDKIQLLTAMVANYVSNLRSFAPVQNQFSKNLFAQISSFCQQIQQSGEMTNSKLIKLGQEVQNLVLLSMSPEFLTVRRVEEIGNFIDQMDRFWSKKLNSVQDYKNLQNELQKKAENFLQFISTDKQSNKAA